MDKKSLASYKFVFEYINNNIFRMEAAGFMTDFEQALQKALRITFPEAKIRGCWFHFCQALRRKISQNYRGLGAYIRSSKDAKDMYYKLLCLPLLPPKDIKLTFYVIKEHIVQFDVNGKYNDFLKYFERQWITTVYKSIKLMQ